MQCRWWYLYRSAVGDWQRTGFKSLFMTDGGVAPRNDQLCTAFPMPCIPLSFLRCDYATGEIPR